MNEEPWLSWLDWLESWIQTFNRCYIIS